MAEKKTVAIIHFNTPELTESAIMSLRKHGGMDYRVVVFDNSDQRPFKVKMKGVEIIDNTKGQVLNLDAALALFPDKCEENAYNWCSVRHMMSVQKLWDLIPEGFLLMDSDVLIKKNIDFMFWKGQCAVGHVQSASKSGNRYGIERLVPMLCYINVPLCKKAGVRYFDPERSWKLHKDVNDRRNWYDTGASFLEDIRKRKKFGSCGKRIDIRPLMEHFQSGSWRHSSLKKQAEWLKKHENLWKSTPQMRGETKVAICAIGRNENRYAVEWVEHYRKLGVAKIFIYDNYFKGEDRLSDVLQRYIKTGLVEVIDIHDREAFQCRAYEDCYKKHGNEYAWIGFLDFDEYLRYKGKKRISTMLAQYKAGDVLLVNWRLMTDNGLICYEDKPLAERFIEPMPLDRCVKYSFPENDHVKCFVRGGLEKVAFGYNPHCPDNIKHSVNTKGEKVDTSAFVHPYDHSVMWIDHYWTKTAEEWKKVKLARGFASGRTAVEKFMKKQEKYFFAVNEWTKEKEEIIRS